MSYTFLSVPASLRRNDLQKATIFVFSKLGIRDLQELTVKFVSDDEIADLNLVYRGKNGPTNVLSFPAEEQDYLGDIALSTETLEREASEQGKTLRDHTLHMLVHGILHLLGYDHQTEEEAQEMESIEVDILDGLGINNPYIDFDRKDAKNTK